SVTSILAFSRSASGCMLCIRLVALSSPTEPSVTVVGHVEFTVLPVPPALAAPVEPELALEHPAAAVTVTIAAAASRAHMGMRGLRIMFLSAGPPDRLVALLLVHLAEAT